MTSQDIIQQLRQTFSVVETINLNAWFDQKFHLRSQWIRRKLDLVYRSQYSADERIVFVLTRDEKSGRSGTAAVNLLTELYTQLRQVDISNCFVILITNNRDILELDPDFAAEINPESVSISMMACQDAVSSHMPDYGTPHGDKISAYDAYKKEQYLLTQSQTFCMYPWIHLHAYPTGVAYPCCMADMNYPIGDCKTHTLAEIWNDQPLKDIRIKMLNNEPVDACARCYEKEKSGFVSGRQSANTHHGHHIQRALDTNPDGSLDQFQMAYWDIRYSNLCNLRCRSCGYIFSSQWYGDQVQLAGAEWKSKNSALIYAGRTETDMWEQLVPHLDYVEQIYFAGGEPLLMEEHYHILDELERRKRFDVRLVYNTNFTHTQLKNRSVFDYWKKFDSVSVGASLDASHRRAEYIRKGTNWEQIVRNRQQMLQVSPEVDFYISPTVSIFNAHHVVDFHREWVELGLIGAQDLNVNVLQDPPFYRIDIAPMDYKQVLAERFERHLDWLRPQDHLRRATVGFESAIKFMQATDNSDLLAKFWHKTQQLDHMRQESWQDFVPELAQLA